MYGEFDDEEEDEEGDEEDDEEDEESEGESDEDNKTDKKGKRPIEGKGASRKRQKSNYYYLIDIKSIYIKFINK